MCNDSVVSNKPEVSANRFYVCVYLAVQLSDQLQGTGYRKELGFVPGSYSGTSKASVSKPRLTLRCKVIHCEASTRHTFS